ncbi:MAG: hypothetical protein RLZZ253_855 [Verrucomicrobiota bacterium]
MMIHRHWNWQQTDWPTFRFERGKLEAMESQFLLQSGVFSGRIHGVRVQKMTKRRLFPKIAQWHAAFGMNFPQRSTMFLTPIVHAIQVRGRCRGPTGSRRW